MHLVLENDLNDARRLVRGAYGEPVAATAQWNDDVHHALHVLATGETHGYYVDYAHEPRALLARALAEGFAYQGQPSPFRGGQPRGTPSAKLPPLAFVNALQTHDQVGNRAHGERIGQLARAAGREAALRALRALVLLAPAPPLLFMGEEFDASTPFLYFCDFDGDLADAVRNGRRAEFGHAAQPPDPIAAETFAASKLDWAERGRAGHAEVLAHYTELLRVRATQLVPWLDAALSGRHQVDDGGTLRVSWPLAKGHHWHLVARLADTAVASDGVPGECVYRTHADEALAPWSVQAWLERP